MGVEATSNELTQAGNLYQTLANQALPESGLSSGSLADIEVGQTNAYNQRLMDAAGIKAAGKMAGIQSAVGGIQSGLGLYAGSLGSGGTSLSKSKIPSGTTAGASKVTGLFGGGS
jgi:hypothetical protein